MTSWMKTVFSTVAFAVPVTITCMDYIGMVVKVEGASMQVGGIYEIVRFFLLKLISLTICIHAFV